MIMANAYGHTIGFLLVPNLLHLSVAKIMKVFYEVLIGKHHKECYLRGNQVSSKYDMNSASSACLLATTPLIAAPLGRLLLTQG